MINTNITGETMIFKSDKGFYSTSMSKKKADNTGYESAYINVAFKKGVYIPNKTLINIKNAFLTFDKTEKDGKSNTYYKIFVTDYEVASNNGAQAAPANTTFSSTDDLPF